MPKRTDFDQKNITISLGVFIAISLGVGSAIGIVSRPDDWFFALENQVVVPPQWILSLGWSLYFIASGLVGHALWRRSTRQRHWRWSIWVWCAHTVMMWTVSPVLYLAHRPGVATVLVTLAAGLMFDLGLHTWRREPKLAPHIVFIYLWLVLLMALGCQFTVQHLSNLS